MTATQHFNVAISTETAGIIQKLLGKGVDLFDILVELGIEPQAPAVEVKVPKTPVITDGQRAALAKLPEIFGQVVPTTARKLTAPELDKLAQERDTIDLVTTFLGKRKNDAIKHIVSNHFDRVVEDKGLDKAAHVDQHGHYVVRDEVQAEGAGKKFVRQVSEGKPTFNHAGLAKAFEDDQITKEQYYALTSLPEVRREINPTKAAKAIAADPSLLGVLAQYGTTPGSEGAAIYLRNG